MLLSLYFTLKGFVGIFFISNFFVISSWCCQFLFQILIHYLDCELVYRWIAWNLWNVIVIVYASLYLLLWTSLMITLYATLMVTYTMYYFSRCRLYYFEGRPVKLTASIAFGLTMIETTYLILLYTKTNGPN